MNRTQSAETPRVTTELTFEVLQVLEREISRVIVGQPLLIRRLLTALFAAIPYAYTRSETRSGCGHVLLEGVPGVAKTLTITTLAHAISARFQRIQLTPDMLPADIVGTRIYDAATASFRIEKGPVFTNILLADEINRATPKTQSGLLEAMQERQVTLADTTFRLDDPFWVLATQNPVEQEGVYPLPEAQLDRFSMMLTVDYPGAQDELQMLRSNFQRVELERQVSPTDVAQMREFIRGEVHIDDRVREYIVRIGRATRNPAEVSLNGLRELLVLGVSPRSYQHILSLVRVTAFFHGRTYVLPQDVKEIYCDANRHRIVRSIRAQTEGISADALLNEVLASVPIP
jgi:MoxR-like ATPase